jgi:hypothetical protein
MHCKGCKKYFCMWCRKIIVAGTSHRDESAATHAHIFECHQRPQNHEMYEHIYVSYMFH